MNETIQTAVSVLTLVSSVGGLCLAVYVNMVVNSRVTSAESKLYERINDHAVRIAKLESGVGGLPQLDDFKELSNLFRDLHGDLQKLAAETTGVKDTLRATQASVQRINDYLLNEKKK